MFKCKKPEMIAYKNELYEHIYTWFKEQDVQHTLLEMIQAALSKDTFKLPQEYINFWESTRQKTTKIITTTSYTRFST